ncbi:MAG: M48 family metallopeptidase [bacterium]|nr:M48 family metallopeptidase [bacterium]
MDVEIRYTTGKTARARIRAGVLQMSVPRHWPVAEKERAIARFRAWGVEQRHQVPAGPPPEWPEVDPVAFKHFVLALNAETLRVSVTDVRLGQARYTRLAQANVKTGVLTFSRHAVRGMEAGALRYLVIHELAHLIEANHSPAFWRHVARFVPDYRTQRKRAQAHFQQVTAWLETEDARGAGGQQSVPFPRESGDDTPVIPVVSPPARPVSGPAGRPRSWMPVQLRLFDR